MIEVSVIVPTKKSREVTIDTIRLISRSLSHIDHEIIVVVNNAKKDVYEEYLHLAKSFNNALRIIQAPRGVGKAGSFQIGIAHARGTIQGFVDDDLGSLHSANSTQGIASVGDSLRYLIDSISIGEADCTFAHRDPRVRICPRRRFISHCFNQLLVSPFFSLPFRDTQCGAKFFTKDAISHILSNTRAKGMEFDVELLYWCQHLGYKLKKVDVEWDSSEPVSILGAIQLVTSIGFPMAMNLIGLKLRVFR